MLKFFNRLEKTRNLFILIFAILMVASLVFAFILSFDEVAASLFVSSPSAMTLPVRIFVYIDQNYDPLVTSVSSLLVFAALIALIILERTIGVGRLFGLR